MYKPYIIVLLAYTGSMNVPGQMKKEIEAFYGIPILDIQKTLSTPQMLEPKRNRYKADVVLREIQRKFPKNAVLILSSKEIAMNKHGYYDWGILGYSIVGKEVGLVSTKKIKSKALLTNVTLHEFGHSIGLPHCSSKLACLMKDARGSGERIRKQGKRLCKPCKVLLTKIKQGDEGFFRFLDIFN